MRNKTTKGYLLHIDLDGVLCEGECWSAEFALTAKPIQKNIDLVKDLVRSGNHIIIWTARGEKWRAETKYWLEKNDVWYHALIMGKPTSDGYADDKNLSINDLKKLCK